MEAAIKAGDVDAVASLLASGGDRVMVRDPATGDTGLHFAVDIPDPAASARIVSGWGLPLCGCYPAHGVALPLTTLSLHRCTDYPPHRRW